MFCWANFNLFHHSCTGMFLGIGNRDKLSGFGISTFFYSFWHIWNIFIRTVRWPTDSATVHFGVAYLAYHSLSFMWFWTTVKTSINIAVVAFSRFHSISTVGEITQVNSIFLRWQIPTTWYMHFMFSCWLSNFVYIIKATHILNVNSLVLSPGS